MHKTDQAQMIRSSQELVIMENKSVSIDDVIVKINDALADAGESPVKTDDDKIHGIPTDQLPPYVAEIEEDLFQKLMGNFGRLNGLEPTDDTIQCIRFIARAEAVRRHIYRKLALSRLDEFLDESQDDAGT